jgi:hypothetical protein
MTITTGLELTHRYSRDTERAAGLEEYYTTEVVPMVSSLVPNDEKIALASFS